MPQTAVRPSQIANVPLLNNLVAIVKADPTEVTFSNSAAENTLWSYTLPGGLLGANDSLVFEAFMNVLQNSGGTRTYTLRFKYGGTVVVLAAPALGSTASALGFHMKVAMKNAGATNSQKAISIVEYNGLVAGSTAAVTNYGTSAIDSTTNQAIVLTVQSDAATATQTIVQNLALLSYYKNT